MLLQLFLFFFLLSSGWFLLVCTVIFLPLDFFLLPQFFWKGEDKWSYMIHWTTRDDSGVIGKYCIYSVLTVRYATRNVILAHKVAQSSLHLEIHLFLLCYIGHCKGFFLASVHKQEWLCYCRLHILVFGRFYVISTLVLFIKVGFIEDCQHYCKVQFWSFQNAWEAFESFNHYRKNRKIDTESVRENTAL